MIRLAVAGATGRMGRCLLERAACDTRFKIAAALVVPGAAETGSTLRVGDCEIAIGETLDAPCDVLVDFSGPSGTMAWLDICRERAIPIVIGATGHDADQEARIRRAATLIPVVKAPNCSVGINALLNLVGRLAKELGPAYDVEIIEAHHRKKLDAPSGTALAFLDAIAEATGRSRDEHAVFGRHGQTGERPRGEIGIHAVRMGDFVGWHEVHLSGPGETVTLRHTAHSRDTFAAGALRAAAWIIDKPAGYYTMRDVLK